jgi:hypothetical protein
VLDTRPAPQGPIGVASSAPLAGGSEITLQLAGEGKAIPVEATAALLNVTIDEDASLDSFLTIYPTGDQRPFTSANNAIPGQVAANSIMAKLGTGGSINIYNQQGAVNVVIDLVGYVVPLADAIDSAGVLQGAQGEPGPAGPQGPAGPVGATGATGAAGADGVDGVDGIDGTDGQPGQNGIVNGAVGGNGLLGTPVTVLNTTAWTTVGTFTAPEDGNYLLQANIGTTFESTGAVAAGAVSTTNCRWSNNPTFTLGASISAGLTITLIDIPGVDTANIALPGFADGLEAGDTVDLECSVEALLAVNSRTALNAAFTAIQINSLS